MATQGAGLPNVDAFLDRGVALLAERGVTVSRSDVGRLLDAFVATLTDDARVRVAAAAIYGDGETEDWLTTVDGSPNAASYHYARTALRSLAGSKEA